MYPVSIFSSPINTFRRSFITLFFYLFQPLLCNTDLYNLYHRCHHRRLFLSSSHSFRFLLLILFVFFFFILSHKARLPFRFLCAQSYLLSPELFSTYLSYLFSKNGTWNTLTPLPHVIPVSSGGSHIIQSANASSILFTLLITLYIKHSKNDANCYWKAK